jgi:hypothetical protein
MLCTTEVAVATPTFVIFLFRGVVVGSLVVPGFG